VLFLGEGRVKPGRLYVGTGSCCQIPFGTK